MGLEPFDILYEADLPAYKLPADLHHLYGRLGFADRVVYSNFVSSLDGVVSLGSKPSAGSVISGKYPADRFLMGLLRACADAVLIGAGTMRATPGHLWTPAHVYPEMATEFLALRSALARSTEPQLAVITASGNLDASHPALVRGAVVMTTEDGARAIESRLPKTCEVVALGKKLHLGTVLAGLHARGLDVVLTEGGPHVMGQLIEAGLLDEVFLTVSPVIAGWKDDKRLGMVAGVGLLPGRGAWTKLSTLRRNVAFLFLRSRTPRPSAP